ncbi:MAG: GNAT family N-acetyltransferase [Pseudorhizobium sp.]
MPGLNMHTDMGPETIPPPVEPMPLDLSSAVFDVVTSPAAIEAEWRSLESLPRNSLDQSYDWCCAWWNAHALSPVILRARIGERTVMLLPLEVVSRYGLRTARLPGERFNNINTGLFSADFPTLDGDALGAFMSALCQCLSPLADTLVLDCMPVAWGGEPSPLAGLAATENPNPSFQLPLLATMDETIAQLNAKTRRKRFRQQCRRLEAIGGFEHYCPTGKDEQHDLLDRFFEQKAERFSGFGLPDVFQPPQVRQFLHDLIDRSGTSRDTPLTMHGLRLKGENEGTLVAISGLSRKGGHVLCQFGSIDDKLCADASPGELLFWLMIEQACLESATVFDFGVGDQPYKRSWCTEITVTRDLVLPLTFKGRMAMPAVQGVGRLRMAVKRQPKVYAVVQKLRTLLRR